MVGKRAATREWWMKGLIMRWKSDIFWGKPLLLLAIQGFPPIGSVNDHQKGLSSGNIYLIGSNKVFQQEYETWMKDCPVYIILSSNIKSCGGKRIDDLRMTITDSSRTWMGRFLLSLLNLCLFHRKMGAYKQVGSLINGSVVEYPVHWVEQVDVFLREKLCKESVIGKASGGIEWMIKGSNCLRILCIVLQESKKRSDDHHSRSFVMLGGGEGGCLPR